MTNPVLFAGTTGSDFSANGGVNSELTSSLSADLTLSTVGVNATRNIPLLTKLWRATAGEFWFHYNGVCTTFDVGPNGTISNDFFFQVYDATDVPRIKLQNSAANTLQLQVSADGSAWTSVDTSFSVVGSGLTSTKTQIDIHVTPGNPGSVELYADKVLKKTWSGDLSAAGSTFQRAGLRPSSNANSNANLVISECLVGASSTLNWRYQFNLPTSNGAQTGFTNDYTAVDEGVSDPNDFIYSISAGDVETMKSAARTFTGYAIKTVVVPFVAMKGAGGPQHIRGVIRKGSTDYPGPADTNLTYGLARYVEWFDVDPSTSADWTPANAGDAALEYGVKSTA